jgi:hypothetical protein
MSASYAKSQRSDPAHTRLDTEGDEEKEIGIKNGERERERKREKGRR